MPNADRNTQDDLNSFKHGGEPVTTADAEIVLLWGNGPDTLPVKEHIRRHAVPVGEINFTLIGFDIVGKVDQLLASDSTNLLSVGVDGGIQLNGDNIVHVGQREW